MELKRNPVKQAIRDGRTVFGLYIAVPSPVMVELAGYAARSRETGDVLPEEVFEHHDDGYYAGHDEDEFTFVYLRHFSSQPQYSD